MVHGESTGNQIQKPSDDNTFHAPSRGSIVDRTPQSSRTPSSTSSNHAFVVTWERARLVSLRPSSYKSSSSRPQAASTPTGTHFRSELGAAILIAVFMICVSLCVVVAPAQNIRKPTRQGDSNYGKRDLSRGPSRRRRSNRRWRERPERSPVLRRRAAALMVWSRQAAPVDHKGADG